MTDLVLVHTGNSYPSYLNDNLRQCDNLGIQVHLIISDSLFHYVENCPFIKAIKESEVANDAYKGYRLGIGDANFRDDFLHRASSRFFLIAEYSRMAELENFFHIENDVLLYNNLSDVNRVLSDSKFGGAVVVDAHGRCVPSIVWFRNWRVVDGLCHLLSKQNYGDDMKNLYSFWSQNPQSITNLPILPTKGLGMLERLAWFKADNLFKELGCIFDGAAIGQYLGGIDPRNQGGDTSGFINETTAFNVSKAKYEFRDGKPFMIIGDEAYPIVNLHIHCKDLKKFIYA